MTHFSLKRNFAWLLTSKGIVIMAGFLTGGLINRSLGPSGRGLLAEMQTWAALLMIVFGLSMDTAIYHIANRDLYGEEDRTKFNTVLSLSFIYAVVAALMLVFLVFFHPQGFSQNLIKLWLLLDVFLILSLVSANITTYFQSLGEIAYTAKVGIWQSLLSVAIIVPGFAFGAINIEYIFFSLIIAQLFSLAVFARRIWSSGWWPGNFSESLGRKLILVGLKQHIATIATFIYTRVNQLIVLKYCGSEQAGLFAVALSFTTYLMIVPSTFQSVLYPRVIHAPDDFEVTVRSLRLNFYAWSAIIILLMLLTKPIIILYAGRNFLPAVNISKILLISAWLLPLSSMIAPYYIKKGAFNFAAGSAVVLGMASIGINLFLVPRYQAFGAALATSLTCLIGFIFVLIFLWHLSGKNPLVIFKPSFKEEINYLKQLKGNFYDKKD